MYPLDIILEYYSKEIQDDYDIVMKYVKVNLNVIKHAPRI